MNIVSSKRDRSRRLAPLAVAGGAVGAVLLLFTPAGVFGRIVPFPMAFAALALLVQPRVSAWQERHPGKSGIFWSPCGLFAVWVYDGYWGAGAGVMSLAVLLLTVEKGSGQGPVPVGSILYLA
ncbi:MAG: TSUP family transporter [Streptosporangiaceae bacterium]